MLCLPFQTISFRQDFFPPNFPCKRKDLICFGFFAGAQKSLPLVLDELTQLVMDDILVHCAFFLPSLPGWCGSSSKCWSGVVSPQVWICGSGEEDEEGEMCKGGIFCCCSFTVCVCGLQQMLRSGWHQVLNIQSRQATVSYTGSMEGKTRICSKRKRDKRV